MSQRSGRVAAWLLGAGMLLLSRSAGSAGDVTDPAELLRFGAQMAREGNWREARFRWEHARTSAPANARIVNNLAVACEALGDPAAAQTFYERAVKLAPKDKAVADNFVRFRSFQSRALPGPVAPDSAIVLEPDPAVRADKKGGKTWKVMVHLRVPPRLDISMLESVLVASFLVPDETLVDVNKEAVRFVRSEFRKRSALTVLDVNPPPAVPEQTIDDLAANDEFWKHLGREHAAELIVSGEVDFTKSDASGFQEVDSISPVTGQKVRQTRFVEQERFDYFMEVLFVDAASGNVLLRDRLKKSSTYTGLANDPITAFYDLIEATAADVRGVVSTGTRDEERAIFRK